MSWDLGALTGDDGLIIGAAVDHRDSLRTELAKRGIDISDDDIGEIKALIAQELAPVATLLLLDVEIGAPAAIGRGALANGPALVVPLEDQGYGTAASGQDTSLKPGFSPRQARDMGASACKLLLPFRSDIPDQAARQLAVATQCAAACRDAGIPLVLEPIVYRRNGEHLTETRFADLVVEAATRLTELDPGILKLQFPGTPAACNALNSAVDDSCWVLLGGGADEETLLGQLRSARQAGASGFIVGRTLWASTLVADRAEREQLIRETVRARLERLADAIRS